MKTLKQFNREHAAAMRKHFGDKYEPYEFHADVECPYCGVELKCDSYDDFDAPFELDGMQAEKECPCCGQMFILNLSWSPYYEAELKEA